MRVPLSWLREFAPTDRAPEDLAEVLTARGAEVETIERPWEGLAGVVVARVLEVRDHPSSDTLCLARVDTGNGEVEVVVGVRNMAPGDLVPFAPPGARVPTLPEPLGRREIRGVVSNGMLCSPHELRISPDHGGILVLPPDLPVGADVKAELGLDDAVLDIAVTPNRPDLLSVIGVAREVAAATGVPLSLPDTMVEEGEGKAADVATVEIRDLERCPRYLARIVTGVTVGAAPLAVQARLTAAGMRPLSNVVDATNYALLELGQPLHPFDLARLAGPGIVVRRAEDGEQLETLDGIVRTFTDGDLLIADLERAVAIAGVMGSSVAEVAPETKEILLESAHFERTGIARTSRRLGLSTEASRRFERGADPEAVPIAADRAAALIARWTGGTVLAGAVDAGRPHERRRVRVRPERASAVLGLQETGGEIVEALGRIGIEAAEADGQVEAEIPGFRPDLEAEIDLIEEVVRVQGYDGVGATLPPVRQAGGLPASYAFRMRVRRALAGAGLFEIQSYSFASPEDLALMGTEEAVRIANPLSAEEGALRTSLVPGLLKAVGTNLARQVRGASLFEVGRVFLPGDPVAEIDRIGAAMAGQASAGYPEPARMFDVSDAKGALEVLLEAVGIGDWSVGEPPGDPFHPGRSAEILIGGERAGSFGELDPRVAARLDLPERVAVLELDQGVLERNVPASLVVRPVPRFPPVRRDLAFIVAGAVAATDARRALIEAGGDLVDEVTLFDVFHGDPIPEGKASLAFSVDLRAPDRTLTDEEADVAVARIVERLRADFGAELRAG